MFHSPECTIRSVLRCSSAKMAGAQKPLSYASMTSKSQFPKRENAIVLEANKEIALEEYIYAIGDIIGPQNILFASKISNGRVCIYVSTAETAKDLTLKYSKIKVCNQDVDLRLLISKHKRVVLSNVSPSIPHFILEECIDKLQIRRESSVSFLRAGYTKPGYAHILSFRRQLYIHADDESKIPESTKVTYEGVTYWIYLSTETTLKCFVCNNTGHIAKNCQLSQQQHTNDNFDINTNIENQPALATISHTQNTQISYESTKPNTDSTLNTASIDKQSTDSTSDEENVESN